MPLSHYPLLKYNIFLYLLIILGCSGLFLNCGSEADGKESNTLNLWLYPRQGTAVKVRVEIADNEISWAQGLMFRKNLPADSGMLFIFPDESERSFWMKNTLIPLDIIFIDGNKQIVAIAAETTPLATTPIFSQAPARYVLEVNGGFCRGHHIAKGDKINW